MVSLQLPLAVPNIGSSQVRDWFWQFKSLCGAKQRFLTLLPNSLGAGIAAVEAQLNQSGYQRLSQAAFFDADGRFCFLPFKMQHKDSASAEYLVPVFYRHPDGLWKKSAILNGYALEGLSKAASALKTSDYLAEMLLPTGLVYTNGHIAYSTLQGYWHLETRLNGRETLTDIAVYQNRQSVFYQRFVSCHQLSYSLNV